MALTSGKGHTVLRLIKTVAECCIETLCSFFMLPTLIHRAVDTKHDCTTYSHYSDIGSTSPEFIILMLSV